MILFVGLVSVLVDDDMSQNQRHDRPHQELLDAPG